MSNSTVDRTTERVAICSLLLLLAGCVNHTSFGPCVGLGDKQNPKLHYKVSTQNVIVGIVFVELIAPPVIVIVDETFCPIGPAETP